MKWRFTFVLSFAFGLSLLGVQRPAEPAPAIGDPVPAISLKEFDRLIKDLSEPEGYFDTDNFISNEAGYLKVLPLFRKLGLRGGVYAGVGPDQNYSYIAEIRPQLAIIIDIRRQNLLQHLYFKALFQLSANRAQYLERLFGRRIKGVADPLGALISNLIARVDATSSNREFGNRVIAEAMNVIKTWNLNLTAGDLESIRYVARAFIDAGPDLRFRSYYRSPRPYYPDYRTLLLETDSTGTPSNYLASEERFRIIQRLHRENRIIPIVGDLAGPSALRRVARALRNWNAELRCFYLSNVEFYLFNGRQWQLYVQNMQQLPWSNDAVLVRTYANTWFQHPSSLPGYYMSTLLQLVRHFLENERSGRNRTYWELVTRDNIIDD